MAEHDVEGKILALCKLCEHRYAAPGGWPHDREGYTCSKKILGLIDCTDSFLNHFTPKAGVTPDQVRPLVTTLSLQGMLTHNSDKPDWKEYADGYYSRLPR